MLAANSYSALVRLSGGVPLVMLVRLALGKKLQAIQPPAAPCICAATGDAGALHGASLQGVSRASHYFYRSTIGHRSTA